MLKSPTINRLILICVLIPILLFFMKLGAAEFGTYVFRTVFLINWSFD